LSRRFRLALALILAALLLAALIAWVQRPRPIVVELVSVERGQVERTVANSRAGTLMACRRARLSPSTGGQIAQLPVREGDQVEQDQLLFEIWNDDLRAQVELASSELVSSRARASEACITAEVAQREAQRLVRLREQRLVSEEAADQAGGQARARAAGCDASRANVEVARSRVLVAEAALARTRLIAPFAGTVAEVNGELGEFVTPSPVGIPTPPAIDLIDTSCLYVLAPIDEVDAPDIRPGMPARILLDAFGKDHFTGAVRRVAPYVLDREQQARTVDVEVDFLEARDDLAMLPGYSADIEVILERRDDVLRIPSETLLEGLGVYVYDPERRTIQAVDLRTGLSNWQYTEVLEGLREGQQIVRSLGREGLADGVRVTVERLDGNAAQ
jgi:HlyD family secretion protein